MFYAIHYTTRSSAATKEDTVALMTEFAKRGDIPGTIAHYIYFDDGGVIIVEQDDPAALYEAVIAYSEWLEFSVRPALSIDAAVPLIESYLGG